MPNVYVNVLSYIDVYILNDFLNLFLYQHNTIEKFKYTKNELLCWSFKIFANSKCCQSKSADIE